MANPMDDIIKNSGSKKWTKAFNEGFRYGYTLETKLPSPAYRAPHPCNLVGWNGHSQGLAQLEEEEKNRTSKKHG